MDCKMNFEECELAILRSAVDSIDKEKGKKKINNPEIKTIIDIVENFLKKKKLICYGGTAINNLLPKEAQFYNKDIEIPDYDFFSPNPVEHAKELADIYYKKGFTEVEAKSGVHAGTFKVFVNYIPVADITYLVPELFKTLKKDSRIREGIYYTSPNYLRMLMYLELSRPMGDVSRWEKVLKRLTLLNKHFPLNGDACGSEKIQRIFEIGVKKEKIFEGKSLKKYLISDKEKMTKKKLKELQENVFKITLNTLIDEGCVFFGAYANKLYYKTIKRKSRKKDISKIPDFDVLSTEPKKTAKILKEKLLEHGYKNVTINKKKGLGEVIAAHYEVRIGRETIIFIYEPLACHSYNVLRLNKKNVRIATIDTMLSFYLAFMFVDREYYMKNRILCMCEYLFKTQKRNKLKQKGLLKRFSIDCYGEQLTIEKMRAEKSTMFNKLKNDRKSKKYEWWFLRYIPHQIAERKNFMRKKTKKIKPKRKTTKRKKTKKK
uniref:Poly(A) polymerase catalytic subunit domain-containing protein n=1 Tax=viral metagenome TaxID=1070528 RepID=A0A6C0FA25_9ZZZZ